MVETKNKVDLLKLLVELGRGPPHLKGLKKYLFTFILNIYLDPDKSFHEMTEVIPSYPQTIFDES